MRRLNDVRRQALIVDRQLVGVGGRADHSPLAMAQTVGPLHSTDPSSASLQIAARIAIEAEGERIASWLGGVRVTWRYPTPLQRSLELQ